MGSRFAHIVIAVALLFAGASCIRRPEGVASDRKMASVLADIELSRAVIQSTLSSADDSRSEAMLAYILESHGLTRAEYDSTMAWYGRNTDAYYELCDLADKELEKKRRKMERASDVSVEQSDLWPYSRMIRFSTRSESDGLTFSVPANGLDKGGRIRFKMRFNNTASGNATLGVEYADGSMQYVVRRMTEMPRVELTLQTDSGRVVSRISGDIRFNDLERKTVWADSVSLAALPFDSTSYYMITRQKEYSRPSRRKKPSPAQPDSLKNVTVDPGVPASRPVR